MNQLLKNNLIVASVHIESPVLLSSASLFLNQIHNLL